MTDMYLVGDMSFGLSCNTKEGLISYPPWSDVSDLLLRTAEAWS